MAEDLTNLLKRIGDFQKSVQQIDPNAFAKIGMQCVAILIVENESQIIYYSTDLANEMFGYLPEQLNGKSILELMPQRFRATHPEHVKEFTNDPKARPMGAGTNQFGITKKGVEFPIKIGLTARILEGKLFTVATILKIE